MGLAPYRIKYIRNGLMLQISQKLNFLNELGNSSLIDYDIDTCQNYIVINQEKANHINAIDQTRFTKQFITLITSVLVQNDFKVTGNMTDAFVLSGQKPRFRHIWKNIYLLKNHLSEAFEFTKFLDDLHQRASEKISDEYKIDLISYISKFAINADSETLDELFKFCEILVNEEIGIQLDEENSIVFKRNKAKPAHTFLDQIIEEIGRPASLTEILSLWNKKYPSKIKNIDTLRTNCLSSPNIILLGGYSTYGLKKWETEKPYTKGGTIRSLMREFIASHKGLVHHQALCNYIHQYRPESSVSSIMGSLYADDKIFFYKARYLGLKSKNYSPKHYKLLQNINFIKRNTWNENFELLSKHISNNSILPSFASTIPEEAKSARWLSAQIYKIKAGKLHKSKTALIIEITAHCYPIANGSRFSIIKA